MHDAVIEASANGFLLGLQVVEHLQGLPLGSTLGNEAELVDLILGIAEGKSPFSQDNAQLLQALPGFADPRNKEIALRKAMEKTAARLIEWYRRQCMS